MTKSIPGSIALTGTGLDSIVLAIVNDAGLNTALDPARQDWRVAQTLSGASAAASLNAIISNAVTATGVAADGTFSADDVRAINAYIRADAGRLADYTAAHGDDEGRVETGFHQVQGDGAVTLFRGLNLVNKVADGLYHIGFEIVGDRFVNEDGDLNASVQDVANWLNYFYLGHNVINGTSGADTLRSGPTDVLLAGAENETFNGYGGDDVIKAANGNDTVSGGAGNDSINGDTGNDTLKGDAGNDRLIGGAGADSFIGGQGADFMDAGIDRDVDIFVFNAGDAGGKPNLFDRIVNFSAGIDKIDLTGLGPLTFGGSTFHKAGPEVIVRGATVLVDLNHDAKADFGIQMLGNVALTASDFIL